MALSPFNESKDKITEREVVFDFFERLKTGKQLRDGSDVFYEAGTFITSILTKLIRAVLPPTVVPKYGKARIGNISVAANSNGGSTTITGLTEGKLLRAISEQTGLDVTECLTTSWSGAVLTVSMITKVPYLKADNIKIYAV